MAAVTLYPLFANRVMSSRRKDYAAFIEGLGLEHSESPLFVFELLDRSGGRTATDRYRLFLEPEIEPTTGEFEIVFFVAGQSRERHAESLAVWEQLAPGSDLQLRAEPGNKFSSTAVQVYNNDASLGYVPDYFAREMIKPLLKSTNRLTCKLVRFNEHAAPQERILVQVRGIWNLRERPFNNGDFTATRIAAAVAM